MSPSLLGDNPSNAKHDLKCPECGAPLQLHWSRQFNKYFYGCTNWPKTGCTGAHGAHMDGNPYGFPVDKETKAARIKAHTLFDRLWREEGMPRKDAYRWLQKTMRLPEEKAHIGKFDLKQCQIIISILEEQYRDSAENAPTEMAAAFRRARERQ